LPSWPEGPLARIGHGRCTLLTPDCGTARVPGHGIVREGPRSGRRVSLTGQFSSVDEDLTGTENLILLGTLLD
jgi:ABC-2 type transport system ATP-binding protein